MAAKRALIVDDSKSARTFLACILEKYELTVDMAENAEQALEYLQTAKPDVIFMDHLMPGMDGFQALQSIKNDPRTAMIPILMYTSQEGELYLGQARALGAIGVLPKQIKPADVSRVLYQLRILPDRRNADVQTTFTRADAAAQAAAIRQAVREAGDTPHLRVVSSKPGGTSTADLRDLVESVVQQHLVDLHRSVTASLDAQSERLLGDVRIAVQEGIAEANREAASAEQARAKRGAPLRRAVAAAGVAALLAAVGFTLWWREALHRRGIAEELRVARQEAAALTARLTQTLQAAASASQASAAGPAAPATVLPALRVPYGELALAGGRLDEVRKRLQGLLDEGFRGTVHLTSYPGRFCLQRAAGDGAFTPAPDATPLGKCDLLGNPFEESLTLAQREPIAFANLVGTLRQQSGGAIRVLLNVGSAEDTVVSYPTTAESLLAGEWNAAAAANNRLEMRLETVAQFGSVARTQTLQ